jgi:hypothetical protein
MMKNRPTPKQLSEKSKRLWRTLNQEFDFTTETAELLLLALENLDLGGQARAQLRREGLTIGGKRNPAADLAKQCDGMALRAFRQLQLDVVKGGS